MLPRRLKDIGPPREGKRRCPAHRAWIRDFGCSVTGCEERPIECAHVRIGTDGGIGLKPSDKWCISLCRDHHAEQHRIGEQSFANAYGINLKRLAEEFFRASPHRHKLS